MKYSKICVRNTTTLHFFLTAKGNPISSISIFKIVRIHTGKQANINRRTLRESRKRDLICEKGKIRVAKALGIKDYTIEICNTLIITSINSLPYSKIQINQLQSAID